MNKAFRRLYFQKLSPYLLKLQLLPYIILPNQFTFQKTMESLSIRRHTHLVSRSMLRLLMFSDPIITIELSFLVARTCKLGSCPIYTTDFNLIFGWLKIDNCTSLQTIACFYNHDCSINTTQAHAYVNMVYVFLLQRTTFI